MNDAALLWIHALAALASLAAAWSVARGTARLLPRRALAAALAITALWALAVAGIDAHDVSTEVASAGRTIAWLAFMGLVARGRGSLGAPLGAVYVVAATLAAVAGALAIAEAAVTVPAAAAAIGHVRLLLGAMALVAALVLLVQLDRAAGPSRGAAELAVAGLWLLWATDLAVAAVALVAPDWSEPLLVVRGGATIAAVGLLAMASERGDSATIQLSRQVATRTVWALALVGYAALVAAATAAVDRQTGGQGRSVQTAIVIGATAALLTLVSTPWLRAWARVKLAKHLFRHRYDYRVAWQRFTDTLGRPGEGAAPIGERVVQAVAELIDAPAGLLLGGDGAGLAVAARWRWLKPAPADDNAALADHLGATARIVELDPVRAGTAAEAERASVPGWLRDEPEAWAVAPLFHGDQLVGAIVLARPPLDRALDWEDLDLLRVAGRGAASYLAEARAHAALADVARFDEFNRRFAFIMHDLKNLVSGLTLVARNAERHADNPAFRADMIATLGDSADRMNGLLARLSQHHGGRPEPIEPVDAGRLVERIAATRRAHHPVQAQATGDAVAMARLGRLEQVLAHLVQNAIEASGADVPVTVAARADGDGVTIEVADRGCGMAPGFVRDQLFRPFVSTKPGGFGLGAHEARTLVEEMGGRVEVDSRPGEGTRVRLLLPAAVAARAAA